MSKILALSAEEARNLRIRLLLSYKSETGKDFIPVTYLGAYDHLRSFILAKLRIRLEDEASISVHRLRKLFYYTDPAYCPEDKLEALTFGEDFISPLKRIIPQTLPIPKNPGPIKNHIKARRKKFILVGGLLSLSLITYLLLSTLRKPYYFRDDFNTNSIADLKARGWDIMDFDSSLFFPQDTGLLTLRSSRGDYWVNSKDTPCIKNLIYKKIPFMECFEVTTKFSFHGNHEPWQQCGIYLLDEKKNRIHNIRMTFANLGETEPDIKGKVYNRGYQIIKRDHGEASEIQRMYLEKSDTSINMFYLKITRYKNQYKFYMHFGEESDSYTQLGEMTFNFEPRIVSIAAFNGLRMSVHGPLNTASSIPAKFDWIKIKECE